MIFVQLSDQLQLLSRQMLQLTGTASTRNKSKTSDKNLGSVKCFKRAITNENEKNSINYLEKISSQKHQPSSLGHGSGLASRNGSNKKNSCKKVTANLTSIPSIRCLKTIENTGYSGSTHAYSYTTRNIDLRDPARDGIKSFKNLKLGNLNEFPKILGKSVSQTTMNKRVQEKSLRFLDKAGEDRKKIFSKKPIQISNSMKIGNFRLGKKLGSGRFGNVYLAQQKLTKMICAIKVMNKHKIRQSEMEEQVIMEIKVQMYMDHPNLLKIYGYFNDETNVYLVLEYCRGCLFKEFRAKVRLEEEETVYYGKQAISALKYMHNENIIHRDIKPENILLQFGVLKLSDFGWSIYSPLYKRQTFCGTADYVPPEIVEGQFYDERVDIWALGVLLYELAAGKAPFQTKNEQITYEKIVHSQCRFPEHFSKELVGLTRMILDKNPRNRPDLDQVESHPLFERYKTTGRYISKAIWTAWNNL